MKFSLSRRVAAEFLGTGFLVAAVVGSGIMGERLSGGNVAIALLANTIATGAALAALILAFAADFRRAFESRGIDGRGAPRRNFAGRKQALYVAAQVCGGIAGTACANIMFALPAFSISHHARTGAPQWFSEFVATFGLLLVIRTVRRLYSRLAPVCRGSLHRRRVLVYRIHIVRESRRDHRPLVERHVRAEFARWTFPHFSLRNWPAAFAVLVSDWLSE